eukprot:gene14585-10428_t
MQFTPQQLAGGPKFSSVTRIGNWQEEIALEESKVDNFRTKSNMGNLSLRKLESKVATCSQIVPHTFSADGVIRFGDSVILRHDTSGSILACDPYEAVDISPETSLITTIVEQPVPHARNTFRIVRPPKRMQDILDREDDAVVRIGQPFLLACNESLLVQADSNLLAPTLYLASTKKNERTATKRTNRQMVYMTTSLDSDCIWSATIPSRGKANGTERFLQVGQPITVDTSYQFTHRQTNMYLTCDPKMSMNTEFGLEYECYADRSNAYGKIALMVSEFKGLSTSNTLTKPDAATFSWHFVVAQDPRAAVDNRVLPLPATTETIMAQIRQFMRDKGIDSYWNLREYLKSLEKQLTVATGKLDREDVKRALLEWNIGVVGRNVDVVLDLVDRRHMGLIDIQEFIATVRGEIPSQRLAMLDAVFIRLVDDIGDGKGSVGISALQNRFNGAEHPLVALGGYSEQYAVEHMLKCLEIPTTRRPPSKINRLMFQDYYGDLSATIDDDEYFEQIVRSNWSV